MQELARVIESQATGKLSDLQRTPLDDAAVKWAAHSLATYKDNLLRKALLVSAALAEFTNELMNPTDK